MATKQEIIDRLSQCGGLSYQDWIRLLDSIYFDGDIGDVFTPVTSNVLPENENSYTVFSIITEGTYTQEVGAPIVVPEGYISIISNSGGSWVTNGSVKVKPDPAVPDGKIQEDDPNAVSGGEVFGGTILPEDVKLNKIPKGGNILKYSDFDNNLEFIPNTSVIPSGNYYTTQNWRATNQPITEGLHRTNLYLTVSVALVTLDANGLVVNYYSNKGSLDGMTEWSFTTDSTEVVIRFCIHNSQATKGQPNSVYITTPNGYSIPTSDVFVASNDLPPQIVGFRNFQYHTNIFEYSDFNNNLEFVPNQLVTSGGNIILGNNWKSTRQPIRKGIHVTNLYLTASVALVTLDQNGSVVNSYSSKGTVDGLTVWNFTTNDNEVEILTCINNSQLTKGQPNSIYITASNSYQILKENRLVIRRQAFENPKKGVSLGDSVTQYGNYPDIIASNLGVNFSNLGVGGTNLTDNGAVTDLGYLSFCRWADAINSGDFTSINTALDNLIASTTGQTRSRHQRTKDNLATINWDSVEYITAFYGTNDYASSRQLGDIDLDNFDKATIAGAVNYAIDKIQSKYPNIKILFITPTHRFMTTDYVRAQDSDFRTTLNGTKLIEYADTIQEMANLNHIPCKNMYREAFFNRFNHGTYFADGVHPNSLGFEVIGKIISSFIKSKIEIN